MICLSAPPTLGCISVLLVTMTEHLLAAWEALLAFTTGRQVEVSCRRRELAGVSCGVRRKFAAGFWGFSTPQLRRGLPLCPSWEPAPGLRREEREIRDGRGILEAAPLRWGSRSERGKLLWGFWCGVGVFAKCMKLQVERNPAGFFSLVC